MVLVSVTFHLKYVHIVLVRTRFRVATFWESAAHSVDPKFSFNNVYL